MTINLFKISFFLYQGLTRNVVATCRYSPTCSQYALEAIEKYGLLRGGAKAIMRILSCHPLSKRPYIDPV
ncbi:MAG: membrane protein insertion efficiency factor YidD [Candidatus Curtissbacteria bacterium]|nr:membrane protein insertion efficiency factor YidD [Candidatus Curtissbacteria bacterium]